MASAVPVGSSVTPLALAKLIAFVVPAGLLAGAYGFQYIGGLPPCELCWYQRYAHMVALAFAIAAFAGGRLSDRGRGFVWLAALGIFASSLIGGYHAGVEAGIFEGFTQCTSAIAGGSAEDTLARIMAAPLIRCDQVPWSLLGISMAGWNAILSLFAALVVLWLSLKQIRPRR
jgi:disulfide bond formation protein DsbB